MAKAKTYWDEIKNENRYYHAGKGGWECKYVNDTYCVWNNTLQTRKEKKIMRWVWPSFSGLSRSERAAVKNDAKFQRYRQMHIAKMCSDREEYTNMSRRLSDVSETEFRDLVESGKMNQSYITYHYLTNDEEYSLFYRM